MKNTVSTIDNMFDPPQLTKYKIENWKNIAGKKIREALPELNDDQLCDDVNEDVYSDYYDYTPKSYLIMHLLLSMYSNLTYNILQKDVL